MALERELNTLTGESASPSGVYDPGHCTPPSHSTVASWEPGLYAFFILSGCEVSLTGRRGPPARLHYKSAGRSKYVCVSHVKDHKTCVSIKDHLSGVTTAGSSECEKQHRDEIWGPR